jgi:hypothetical protein
VVGVEPRTVVLLHSPLTGAAAWGGLPDTLRTTGVRVVVVEVTDDGEPPYATRYVAAAATQIAAALAASDGPADPLVLVGHSGAGPLLAQVGFARRAARAPVGGYVFLDAGLPRPARSASRLELMETEDAAFAADLRDTLEAGESFPAWTDTDLRGEIPDDGDRALLLASLRPRGLDFFTEPLPAPTDWPDAPCAYLQTSDAYATPARLARGRAWPTTTTTPIKSHFAAMTNPEQTATALQALLRRM